MIAILNYICVGLDRRSVVKCHCVTWIIVFGLIAPVIGQNPQNFIPRIDRSQFERRSGPVTSKGSTGVLGDKSGSRVAEAELLSSSFAYSKGRVSVEVVKFPKGYLYAPHDVFGLLSKGSTDTVKFRAWEYADGSRGGIVCSYSYEQEEQKQKGSVLWFHGNADEGFVTIIVGYTDLDGAPGMVIDDLLREHASDVPENPTWHHDWETKDLEKWTEVLKANKGDLQMLQAGAAYLMRYDKRSFGLLDALKKRDDAAAYSDALDAVVTRLGEVVTERKQKAKEAGQREK